MTRAEQARDNFLKGYNCTQAIVLAFSDLTDVPESTLKAVALPFGGGLGRLRLTCGAVSGAAIVLGLVFPEQNKSGMYALVQDFARRYREKNGSVVCGELLSGAGIRTDTDPQAEARTAEYYKKRPCPELIYDAAKMLEDLLKEQGKL